MGKAKGSFFKGANRNLQFDGTSGESHRFTLSSDDR